MNRRVLLLSAAAAALVGPLPKMMADPRLDLFKLIGASDDATGSKFESFTTYFHRGDAAADVYWRCIGRRNDVITFPDDFMPPEWESPVGPAGLWKVSWS